MLRRFIGFLCLIFVISCSSAQKNEVWIYTSIPPEHIAEFDKLLKVKFPDQNIKWYQSGSENISSRIAMEITTGDVKADLVMTGDYFWYLKMNEQGFWSDYKPNLVFTPPSELNQSDWPFSVMRYTTMVIAYNKKFLNADQVPQSFQSIVEPQFHSKLSCGSPLESGTSLVLMNNLAFRYGFDFVKKMRDNDVMVAGSNSNTLSRLVSGERPIAIMLLEHVLKEQAKNPNLQIVYPLDGAVLIPAPVAITKNAKNPLVAQKLYDFFMSDEAQKISVKYFAHAVNPELPPPAGSKPTLELLSGSFQISNEFLSFVKQQEGEFKNRFSQTMFE